MLFSRHEFTKNTYLYREGDPLDYAYLITCGEVEFSKQGGRKPVRLKRVAPSQLVGAEYLADQSVEHRLESAQAVSYKLITFRVRV